MRPLFCPAVITRLLTLAALACLLAVTGCGKETTKGDVATSATTGAATQVAKPSGTTAAGCRRVVAPAPREVSLKRPTARLDRAKRHVVRLQTTCGNIDIKLDEERQPRTAASFAYIVREGVLDGAPFHRIVADFVVQGGDPLGTGQGSAGYTITEAPPRNAKYTVGTVAMAKTEIERPGTSGSQFFIVTGQGAPLEPIYAVLGRVVGGEKAVDRIAQTPADPTTGMPDTPVVIEKATLSVRG